MFMRVFGLQYCCMIICKKKRMVCTFVFKPICFLNAKFWPFWPIWAMLPRIYALFGAFLQVEIMRWCTNILDKYDVCCWVHTFQSRCEGIQSDHMCSDDHVRQRQEKIEKQLLCRPLHLLLFDKNRQNVLFWKGIFLHFVFFCLSFFWSCPFEDVKCGCETQEKMRLQGNV